MIFVVIPEIPVIPVMSGNRAHAKIMIEINNSYNDYAANGERSFGDDRLTIGSALLVVMGLSLFGWAVVFAPLVAIFHN
jgi:hypothetical protein